MAKLNLFRSLMGTFYLRLVYLDCKKFIVDVYGCITSWGEIYHEVLRVCMCLCLFFSSENKLESTYTLTRHVWNTSSKKFCGCFGVCVCARHDKSIMFLSFRCCLFPASSRHDSVFIFWKKCHFYSDSFLQIRFYVWVLLIAHTHTPYTYIHIWR